MIKIIDPASFAHNDPVVSLMELHSRGPDRSWMSKRAAMFTKEVSDLKPEPGKSFLHLISLGSGETYSTNRNGDYFNEKEAEWRPPHPHEEKRAVVQLDGGLIKYHPTFMRGHVFEHHINSDPRTAIGEIKAAVYNPEMHRGELIICVPHGPKWDSDLQKIASGDQVAFSMSCRVSRDICSICGHHAASRAEYCDHARNQLTDILKEGHQVFVINDNPNFFDISKVFRPADRIAWSLRKVASARPIGGAEMAEMLGLAERSPAFRIGRSAAFHQKLAVANKLADMEKTIEAIGSPIDIPGGVPSKDIPDDTMKTLRHGDLNATLRGLGDAKIVLSLRDFIKLVMGEGAEGIDDAEKCVPGMFSNIASKEDLGNIAGDDSYDGGDGLLPREILRAINGLEDEHSIAEGPVGRRVRITIIKGGPLKMDKISQALGKSASASPRAEVLVREYAKYLVSFRKQAGEASQTTDLLTILRGRFILAGNRS